MEEADDGWKCDVCTLVNPKRYLVCSVCETIRRVAVAAHHPVQEVAIVNRFYRIRQQ